MVKLKTNNNDRLFFSHYRPSRCWNRLYRRSRLRLDSTIRLTLPKQR